MIGIVSDHEAFRKAIERLLQAEGWNNILLMPPELKHIQSQLAPSAPLILDGHIAVASGIRKGGLTLIRHLRSDPTWRYVGPIILLAYESAMSLGHWPDAEVLNTRGVKALQIPFTVARFQAALASTPHLLEAEWDEINRRLGPESVADRASKLGHDYEGAFRKTTTALIGLQKLKGCSDPDFQKVREKIGSIHSQLTEERLGNLFTDLKTLHTEADRLGLTDETCSQEKLDDQVAQVRQGLALLNLSEDAGKLDDICRVAGEIRSTLKELRVFCRAIKEKAIKEANGGS